MEIEDLPRRDVAIHFLRNQSAVVFDETTQDLFALDQTAAFVWCSLLEGDRAGTIDDLATRADVTHAAARVLVDKCLGQWRDAGLTEPRMNPARNPAAGDVADTDSARRRDFPDPATVHDVLIAGMAYQVRVETPPLAAALAPLLGDLPSWPDAGVSDNGIEGRVDIVAVGDAGAEIYFDGWLVDGCDTPEELAPMVKFCLTGDRVDGAEDDIALHGGLVTWPDAGGAADRGVLIAGPAGTGKSTLAGGLVAAGYGHASDDTVLFDLAHGRFQGFGFPAGLKHGAWPVLEGRFPELATAPTHRRADGVAVRYLPRRQPVDHRVAVDTVVFPTFAAGAMTSAADVDTAVALRRLLAESGSGIGYLTQAAFSRFATWLDGARVVDLRYDTLVDGVAAVAKLRPSRQAAA